MKRKDFEKLMARDGGCVHCGEIERVSPNHRINRGMGGSKLLDRPSNLVVLCSDMNFLIESDPLKALEARQYGWKLSKWQSPENEPVFDKRSGVWFVLDNGFGKTTL